MAIPAGQQLLVCIERDATEADPVYARMAQVSARAVLRAALRGTAWPVRARLRGAAHRTITSRAAARSGAHTHPRPCLRSTFVTRLNSNFRGWR